MSETAVAVEADGTIVVGSETSMPAGHLGLELLGSVLLMDLTQPSGVEFRIDDLQLATPMLVATFGREFVDFLGSLTTPSARTMRTVQAGPSMAGLMRFAALEWLGQWSPDELDIFLLAVETSCAADDIAELLPDVDEVHRRCLLPNLEQLLARHRSLLEGAAVSGPGLRQLYEQGVRIGLSLVHPEDELYTELEHAHEIGLALRGLAVDVLSWDTSRLAERDLGAAAHAGAVPVAAAEMATSGRASVDWHQVPRGILVSEEDTISWESAGGTLRVRVSAVEGAPPVALAFQAVEPGTGRVAVGALTWEDGEYTGEARFPEHLRPEVDVFVPGGNQLGRPGRPATGAEAERWAVRGVALLRFALFLNTQNEGNASQLLGRAQDCLERSGRLYRLASREILVTEGDLVAVAVRSADERNRWISVIGLLAAVLEIGGQAARADRVRRTLGAESVMQPARFDFTASLWRLTSTEREMMARRSGDRKGSIG